MPLAEEMLRITPLDLGGKKKRKKRERHPFCPILRERLRLPH